MKVSKLHIVLFILFLSCNVTSYAQILPHLGWFEEAQLFYNPSHAGLGDEMRGVAINRGQWKGISGSPQTYLFSFDTPFEKGLAFGGTLSHDQIASTVENKISADGSYRVYINSKSFVQAGIKGSISNISSRFSELSQWDDGDPLQVDINTFVPRIGFGFTYKTPTYFVGLSLPDYFSYDTKSVLASDPAYQYMRRNYFLSAGTELPLSEYVTFIPTTTIRYYEQRAINLTVNMGLELNQTVLVGLSYVHPSIYGFYGKVALTPRIRFGYRHEYSPSVISVGTFGTGEFLLTYGFN